MTKKNKKETETNNSVEDTTQSTTENEVIDELENKKEDIDDTDSSNVENNEAEAKNDSETEDLSEKYNSLLDKHLRLTAEFDNYRKRTLKEKTDLIKTAGEKVLLNVIPVIDDMERALKSLEDAKDIEAVKQGIELIYNKFYSFIEQNGISPIETKEKEFDTDLHEAVAKIPAPSEEMKGKVIDELQKGYLLYDKVVRHAKVVIGE